MANGVSEDDPIYIEQDPVLLYQAMRWSQSWQGSDASEDNKAYWLEIGRIAKTKLILMGLDV